MRKSTAFKNLDYLDGVTPDKPFDSAIFACLTRFSAMNKLTKMALQLIAAKLSEEEIYGLKQMFKMIDTDNNGHITFEEPKDGLGSFGANLDQSEIHDLMQAADNANNSGIDYEEFVATTLHFNKVDKENSLYIAFPFFDKDGSGYINVNEIQQSCKELGIDDAQVDELSKKLIRTIIDYNEFVAMMQKGSAPIGKTQLKNNLDGGLRKALSLSVC